MGDKIVVKMTFIANFSLPTFQNISAVHASLALQKIVYKLKEPAYTVFLGPAVFELANTTPRQRAPPLIIVTV